MNKKSPRSPQFLAFSMLLATILLFAVVTGFEFSEQKGLKPFTIPTIVGHTDTTTLCLSPAYMLNAWYDIERIDSITGLVDLSKTSDKNIPYYQFSIPDSLLELPSSNRGLQVIADTINELSMTKKPIWARYLFYRDFSDSAAILQDDTLIQQVKSFPIYVANMSENQYATLEVQDGSMMIVVEAVNTEGQWRPIEYWSHSWCGNSYFTLMIPPKHMLMTRGVKCSGDFVTTCRLKLVSESDSLYSNEFVMSINETQFTNPVEKEDRY